MNDCTTSFDAWGLIHNDGCFKDIGETNFITRHELGMDGVDRPAVFSHRSDAREQVASWKKVKPMKVVKVSVDVAAVEG